MKWTELLLAYLKSLFNYWYILAFGLFDIIGVVLQDWLGWNFPRSAYGWIFITFFGIANILVYRDIISSSKKQKEQFEKEINLLQSQITELVSNRPSLSLLFLTDGTTSSHHIIYIDDMPNEPDVDKMVKQEIFDVRKAYEALKENPKRSLLPGTDNLYIISRVPDNEKFEELLADYEEEFKNYLEQLYLYRLVQARFRSLKFVLKNFGSVPAEDIHFFVIFPKEFSIIDPFDNDDIDFEKISSPPKKPQRPLSLPSSNSWLQSIGMQLNSPIDYSFLALPTDVSRRPDGGPYVEKTNDGSRLGYMLDELLHNFSFDKFRQLDFFYLGEPGKVYHIVYQIHAANLPQPQEGTLVLEFQRHSEK